MAMLAIVIGVSAVLVLLWLRQGRSWERLSADVSGIALQTVIVIVVMLVIAGGVSGVLLSRGTDVISDLEDQNVGSITEDNCGTFTIGSATGTYYSASDECVWGYEGLSSAACRAVGGTWEENASADTARPVIAANDESCIVDVS